MAEFYVEFEAISDNIQAEFESVTEVSDGGYDRGYADAQNEIVPEVTLQEELLAQAAEALVGKATGYERGKVDGFAEALDKRTDLVVTENGEYTPSDDSTGFKSVSVNVQAEGGNRLAMYLGKKLTEVTESDFELATYVGESAFSNHTTIKTITLPSHITSIARWAFEYCSLLKTVIVKATTPPTLGSSAFNGCNRLEKIAVPIGSKAAYDAATNWSAKADIIVEEEM